MKKTEMKRVPQLRFPEFTDDWEQRKLIDEVSSIDTGKSKFIAHEFGKYEILGSTAVIGYDSSYDYEGDFLLTARVGANAGELYRHSGKVKISDNTVFIQGNQLDFIYYALVKFDIKRLSFGTGQPLVKASELKEQMIGMPVSKVEREYIGSYFRKLDHLITLHHRKLENLKELRKGMMQKLFSQEVRFKADDGNEFPEWEEKKLDDVAVRVTRKNKDNITDIPLTISSADGLIDQRDFFNKVVASKDMSGYYLLKKGEFAYNKSYSKGYDFGSIKRLDLYAEGALSTLYICFALNKDENSDFYQKYFDSLFWYLELQKICAEGARNHGLLNVSTNEFFQMKLKVPSSKQEQKKIADCLSSLDDVIAKQKATLAAWEELKKGLLQQMFV